MDCFVASPRNDGYEQPTSRRPPAAFPLDHFRGELEIGLAAEAFEIVEEDGFAVGRRFRDAHIARYDRLIDFLAHEGAHVLDNLSRQIVARIVHGQYDAMDG